MIEKGKRYKVINDDRDFFKVGDVVVSLENSEVPFCILEGNYITGVYDIRKYALGGLIHPLVGDRELEPVNCITITQDGELVTAKDESTGTDVTVNFNTEHKDFISASLYAHKKLVKELKKNQPLEVKEVKRRAEAGEYVKIVNACSDDVTNGHYKNGDVLKIINVEDTFRQYGHGRNEYLLPSEYVVLENYQPPVEEPKLYNHKVVCVKAEGWLIDHARVGKIYEFVNGNCSNEVGGKFLSDPVHSIEELNETFNPRNLQFIELKED